LQRYTKILYNNKKRIQESAMIRFCRLLCVVNPFEIHLSIVLLFRLSGCHPLERQV